MKVEPALIHRLFYPQVPVVMAALMKGRVSAMPVVSYASLSDSPPLVAVSCNPGSFTCKLAVRAGSFSLSLLDRSHSDEIARLATAHGTEVRDKLADAGIEYALGSKLNVPLPKQAAASLECALKSKARHGDHLLLVGLVKAAHASDSFTDFWDFNSYRPLLYTGWKGGLSTFPEP